MGISDDGNKVFCEGCHRGWSAPWGKTCPTCGHELEPMPQKVQNTAQQAPKRSIVPRRARTK